MLLLPTTQPETIEQFGIRLAEAWKIGRKGADNRGVVARVQASVASSTTSACEE